MHGRAPTRLSDGADAAGEVVCSGCSIRHGNRTMTQGPHIIVATPAYGGQVTAAYTISLLKLQNACIARGVEILFQISAGDALITRARAELVASFLARPNATHLLFIDSDIGFEPEQVFRLLDFNTDVAAATYPIKELDWDKASQAMAAGLTQVEANSLTYVVDWIKTDGMITTRNDFAKARYAGAGFILVRREALERLCAAHPELRYKQVHYRVDRMADSPYRYSLFECMIDPETGEYLSEDFAFCRRWTALGGEIWLDMKSRLDHLGQFTFHGDLATQFEKAEPRLTMS
jgi:hypothetical protein